MDRHVNPKNVAIKDLLKENTTCTCMFQTGGLEIQTC